MTKKLNPDEAMRRLFRRFTSKISVNKKNGCHEWIAALNAKGYGFCRNALAPNDTLAHRVAWVIFRGDIPEGMGVLHRCDNPCCVNTEHLFLGDQKENMADMAKKGRHPSLKGTDYLPRGRAHHFYRVGVKITRKIAAKIRKDNRPYPAIAAEYGVDRSLVSKIKTGVIWK